MKILIMGLPESGKIYLAERLQPLLESAWYNADKVGDGQWLGFFSWRKIESVHFISATKIRKELREKGDLD